MDKDEVVINTEIIAAAIEMADIRGASPEELVESVDRMHDLMGVAQTFVGDLVAADRSPVALLSLSWAFGYEVGRRVAEGAAVFVAMRSDYENETGAKFAETREGLELFSMWLMVRRMKEAFATLNEDDESAT